MSAATAKLGILAAHRKLQRRRHCTVGALCLATLLTVIADVLVGPAGLHPMRVLHALLGLPGSRRTDIIIVQQIRLPQALAGLVVGAFLALSGAQLQTVFNNPLAEGVTLGIAPAAAFGAAIAIVLGVSLPFVPDTWIIAGNAFLLAFLATLVLMALSALGGGTRTLMLFGVGLVFTFNALIALLQILASQAALQQLTFWMLGSLSGLRWDRLWPLLGLAVILIPWSLAAAPGLTALRLGEERAISLGLDIRRLRLATFLRVSLMTGAAVASVGSIGFVGLVGPHIARLLVGEDHRIFLPVSAISGALILLIAQLGAKLVLPDIDVPVGITTALIGLPVFFALIATRRAA